MALINRGAPAGLPDVLPALAVSDRCSLCEIAFRVGDGYKVVWPKQRVGIGVALSITVHLRCFEQLDPGDLARIFDALERGLALPLRIVRGPKEVGGG